ncbi:P-loop containing nucleoside triphosphate hydrolase protein [Hygrophoropsis aurantiaca]|uniref:P-loop containing nucleoside triphosphate hydrolase protein n=1 Tax=Hygrophoropsis aurantiaca TaxID=72124 RepID=A0ACB8A8G2_9AGAM|nr:P-loop containing nucleoside triphosphate hydrolase protein [Hygrophoropsis aurantiaca]
MAFFSRSTNQTPQPPAPYSRLPQDNGVPGGLRPSGRPQPPPHYNDPSQSLFESKRSYDRKPPPARSGMSYAVTGTPNESLALKNCLIVHPSDFPSGAHVLVKGRYPMTTFQDTSGSIPPGTVAISASQREWLEVGLSGSQVTVDMLPPSPPNGSGPSYIQSLDLTIGFMKLKYENKVPYNPDEMIGNFQNAFNGVVLAPGEILTFDFKGDKLKVFVTSMSVVELADEQKGGGNYGSPSLPAMGILMNKTDITVIKAGDSAIKIKSSAKKAASNAIIAPNFKFEEMGIGGLDDEFGSIFRRAFASRVFPPQLVEKLGIQHVKGILLHGPPGTGKTLIARQIGKMLNAREPKIVNGPEILNKYVGASEENVRKLFADAEKEYKEKGDESGLHIIIFDELDAIFKQRGSTNSGTGVGDSVVNQLLSKMDGVDQLNNILVIGMTNRIDMIDEALLRPGRLEVHMEISLPDEKGRHQILRIHTAKMRTNGVMDRDVDLLTLAAQMKNYSGAEIEGFVKSATSFAFNRHVKVGTMAGISDDVENLRVNQSDFLKALDEIQPAFGTSEEELTEVIQNGVIHYDPIVDDILQAGQLFVNQVANSTRTPLVSILLHGPPGSGKTVLAASMAWASQFPFIKLISPDRMVGFSETQKIAAISKTFADSYKSPLSVIVVDSLERLLDWTSIGPRFSNAVLQTLLVLIARRPPKGRRLLVIATTSLRPLLSELGLGDVFDSELRVPPISNLRSLSVVLRDVELFEQAKDFDATMQLLADAGFATDASNEEDAPLKLQVGIKKLLSMIEMARQEPGHAGERLLSSLIALHG